MVNAIKELNIIIAGVGGQGVVLLSEILGNAAVREGLKVRGSEVLGMAQRGGSVFSNIRLGEEVFSPMTPDGKCDVLISLEPSEALRNIQYLNPGSIVIMNNRKVIPATVSMGKSTYPEIDRILEKLESSTARVVSFDAIEIAEKAGNRQTSNVVMLGALFGSGKIPIKIETIKDSIRERVPARAADVNLKAFDMGYDHIKNAM
ncbi:MAG: indolepyruvate ferredoxin oxidoreductase subunit beta [Dehalococcoidales bacterium]|nr:indolepyruvate ferredoxin oxidoreductase subunit beta [Dehalococcoidales bacterium]